MTKTTGTPIEKLSYEQSYKELEEIIQALETSQTSLEEGITLFERGQALAKHCTTLLDGAELRVQTLTGIDLQKSPDEETNG
jgi:exodeoxyribonuclease VII small subunit